MRQILVVEDDPGIRETLTLFLRMEGYEVISAINGQEGLTLLASPEVHPDLIILDLMMPVMDGWEFLERRSEEPTLSAVPIIVVSGTHSASHLEQVNEFIPKPLELDHLLTTVHRLCRAS